MNTDFLSDGPARYDRARRAELKRAIQAKYAERLAVAGFFRRLMIRREMRRELRRAGPWEYALWGRC
jgi:hypothetical protein